MLENKVTLKLNFSGTLFYDDLFASYRDRKNHIANICLRERGKKVEREGQTDIATQRADPSGTLKINLTTNNNKKM